MPTASTEPVARTLAGWLAHRRQGACLAPRPTARGALIDLIVVHSISLPPGEYGGRAVHDLFMGRLTGMHTLLPGHPGPAGIGPFLHHP